MRKLEAMNIEYVTAVVEEGGITVDQLFFHDPDGYMIEICNCQNLPVLPLSSCPLKLPKSNANANPSFYGNFSLSLSLTQSSLDEYKDRIGDFFELHLNKFYFAGRGGSEVAYCAGEVAALMMENLVVDMMDISL